MDDPEQIQSLSFDHELEIERSIVRQSLAGILSEIEQTTRDAGLGYPIGLTVPSSGDAVMTILTTDDPSDQDWSRVTKIACEVLSRKLGDVPLRCRPLPCAITGTKADAGDLVQECS
jgi:hypothetical protein